MIKAGWCVSLFRKHRQKKYLVCAGGPEGEKTMSKKKSAIELKVIQNAIKERFPMFWERHGETFSLHAITYTWENGSSRTRKLFEISVWSLADMQTLKELHIELMSHYGTMTTTIYELERMWSGFLDFYRLVGDEFKYRRATPPDPDEKVLRLFEFNEVQQ